MKIFCRHCKILMIDRNLCGSKVTAKYGRIGSTYGKTQGCISRTGALNISRVSVICSLHSIIFSRWKQMKKVNKQVFIFMKIMI